MSRLAIPVSHQRLYATGDVLLWVDLTLSLRDGAGNFVNRDFQVDSGTQITTFPAHDARHLGLSLPPRPARIRHEQTGLEVRLGMLGFRIPGMDPTVYAVPCFFLGDPDTPPPPGRLAGSWRETFCNRSTSWTCSGFRPRKTQPRSARRTAS
jgi:hypothetical protein